MATKLPVSGTSRVLFISLALLIGSLWATIPRAIGQGFGLTTRVSVASDGMQGNGRSYNSVISGDGRYVAFESRASNLVNGDTNICGSLFTPSCPDIFVHDRQTGQTARVSVASDGTQGNDVSGNVFTDHRVALSSDGRYVAFESRASNLVTGDTNGDFDIFVHDLQTRQTTRVSITSNGTQANNDSWEPAISSDGRYVAFESRATNLVNNDTNDVLYDIFVYDRQTDQTTLVSVASDGTQGNSLSYNPVISGDGRYVAFESFANNLVNDDTDNNLDIFVHDRQTGQTTRVSGSTQGDVFSRNPAISSDGRYVAFDSDASDLVSGDTNGDRDIFVHDRQTGEITRVSTASDGTQGNNISHEPAISGNGRYIAFDSNSTNLLGGIIFGNEVYVHDRQTGQTFIVSVASDGTYGNSHSQSSAISSDGRYITFDSFATNLVNADTNGSYDIFVHEQNEISLTRAVYLPIVVKNLAQ